LSDVKDTEIKDSEKEKKKERKSIFGVGGTFWVAMVILFILLLLSLVVLGIRLSEYAHVDNRELMLKSNMDTELDIFSVIYKNATGEITVEGLDGQKVIAPGTDVDYTVRLRNKDTIAIDYTLIVQVELLATEKPLSDYEIPLLYRLLDPEDNYLAGDAKTWADRKTLDGLSHNGTIKRGESAEYLFQWKWPFESGDDAYDTFLGNIAGEDVGIKVSFTLRAEANTSIGANGGFWGSGLGRAIWWWLFFILLLIAIILLLISIFKRKKKEPEPEPEPEPIVIPEPEPEPIIPIVIPEPEPEPEPVPPPPPPKPKKKEGFVGKMEYINIDVLDANFEHGDRITLRVLKEKGLIDPKTKQMKILARNAATLEKSFIVETQGISAEARKYIIAAGGKVIITKG
jgi:uncharacterized membrane protein